MSIRNNAGIGTYPEDSINHKDHADHNKPGFLVRATKQGYYGLSMRESGDVFRIQFARHFADHNADHGLGWMEKADGKNVKRRSAQVEQEYRGAKPPPADPSERNRRMAEVDQMAEDAAEEDASRLEAEVI